MFDPWLARWSLTPDGEPLTGGNTGSGVLPVLHEGCPAILKVAVGEEERRGAAVMGYWAGDGAARVLAHEGEAILLERLGASLEVMAATDDDGATRILCAVAHRLHVPRPHVPPATLMPLPIWFRALEPMAVKRGGVLTRSAEAARELLGAPREIAVLHGDLHHGNVLDAGPRGWLAIDPKGLLGDRGYDHANMLCNPGERWRQGPERLSRQARVASEASGIELRRLLKWVLAYAGLSAAWTLGDGQDATPALCLAEWAAGLLEIKA